MHVFTIKVTWKLNRLITFVYNVTTTALIESCMATRKQRDSGVGQEVLMDKCSGGKLGFFFPSMSVSELCDYSTIDGVLRVG